VTQNRATGNLLHTPQSTTRPERGKATSILAGDLGAVFNINICCLIKELNNILHDYGTMQLLGLLLLLL